MKKNKKNTIKKMRYSLNLIKYNIKFSLISLKLEKKLKRKKISQEEILFERIYELDKKSKFLKLVNNTENGENNKKLFNKFLKRFEKNIVIKNGNLDREANVYLVNHQNVFEFFILGKIFKGIPLRTVVKRELKNFKFSKGFCYYDIDIDRSDPKSTIKLFKEIKKSLDKQHKILIFPEGTRNRTDKPLLPFKENLGKLLNKFNIKVQGICIKNLKEFMNGESKHIEIYFTDTYSSKEEDWYKNIYNSMLNYLKK